MGLSNIKHVPPRFLDRGRRAPPFCAQPQEIGASAPINVTAADPSSFRIQGQIAVEMAHHRPGPTRRVNGIQLRGAMETLKVFPW